MTKMNIEIDIKNENELLRIYKNNLKHAKSDAEKAKINNSIENVEKEIDKLEEAEKAAV